MSVPLLGVLHHHYSQIAALSSPLTKSIRLLTVGDQAQVRVLGNEERFVEQVAGESRHFRFCSLFRSVSASVAC